MDKLKLVNLFVEHQRNPIGIDCRCPRFSWELQSTEKNLYQEAYRIQIKKAEGDPAADTGWIQSAQSIEVTIDNLQTEPMTKYEVIVKVKDNLKRTAEKSCYFETGRLGIPWQARWLEPEQTPTEDSSINKVMDRKSLVGNPFKGIERDFSEFQPVQYIRIPFTAKEGVKRARLYVTAHGVYRLLINGILSDDRILAPEITAYEKILMYQTYDITGMLRSGENVIGVELADGWWSGRVGMTGDSCQYGDKKAILLEGRVFYEDGSENIITGDEGKSSTGPLIFSDIFVGEKYDAEKELPGWDRPGFDETGWKSMKAAEYPYGNIVGQYGEPIRPIKILDPERVFYSPAGELIIDVGQVLAGAAEFTLTAPKGQIIKLEHSEVLDEKGNFYNNILGVNKEQLDIYITKEGKQTYRPHFTYHGFRYIKVTGWPGTPKKEDFKIYVYSSQMDDLGKIVTSDKRINRLFENIWWSQVANTISIPTDCPQRERAGWTGDIMAFAPTLCRNRRADAFLTRWLASVRAEQMEDGGIPNVVPFLKSYHHIVPATFGTYACCGWGDAILYVPLALYQEYGDRKILEENYEVMKKWLSYIQGRAENHHPEDYPSWNEERKRRSRYLWNTDFHYGDWLVPSMVLHNTDAMAMSKTAYATMKYVAPEYYAGSAKTMSRIAKILGKEDDAAYYMELYENIRKAFIDEYVHEDGTMDLDLQGVYVIALKFGLYTEETHMKMTEHLRELITKNRGCLDTGFLSVLYLMDVLCDHGCRDTAYNLLFQNKCPSWLYEVEHGATTVWESWGAIGENGEVSTYSYNHYAFGCIGEWMYREIGGIQGVEPGYKKICIKPALDCGLLWASAKLHSPYGMISTDWKINKSQVKVNVQIPCNTTAEIVLPGLETTTVGSGRYQFIVPLSKMRG